MERDRYREERVRVPSVKDANQIYMRSVAAAETRIEVEIRTRSERERCDDGTRSSSARRLDNCSYRRRVRKRTPSLENATVK